MSTRKLGRCGEPAPPFPLPQTAAELGRAAVRCDAPLLRVGVLTFGIPEGGEGVSVTNEGDKREPERDSWRETFQYIGLISQVGLGMAASILIAFSLGLFLDRKLGIGPLFTIVGIFGGVGAGFWNAYRLIMRDGAERDGGQAV